MASTPEKSVPPKLPQLLHIFNRELSQCVQLRPVVKLAEEVPRVKKNMSVRWTFLNPLIFKLISFKVAMMNLYLSFVT